MAAPEKVNYTHDAMIDTIIANPRISQGELARQFGYTQPWVSQIMSSDAFKVALRARSKEIVDPVLVASIEERFESVTKQALAIAEQRLAQGNDRFALKMLDVGSKLLNRGNTGVNIQNNFVVQVPAKSATVDEWAAAHGSRKLPPLLAPQDVTPSSAEPVLQAAHSGGTSK